MIRQTDSLNTQIMIDLLTPMVALAQHGRQGGTATAQPPIFKSIIFSAPIFCTRVHQNTSFIHDQKAIPTATPQSIPRPSLAQSHALKSTHLAHQISSGSKNTNYSSGGWAKITSAVIKYDAAGCWIKSIFNISHALDLPWIRVHDIDKSTLVYMLYWYSTCCCIIH